MRRFDRGKNVQPGTWAFFPHTEEIYAELAEAMHLPLPLARVLVNRGIKTALEGESFLAPEPEQLHSPFTMKDMEIAAETIWQAIREGRRIAVYGDYDVDGIGATALLFTLLRCLGADVVYYIPDRLAEGYGLNINVITRLAGEGVSLLVTVDCGIGNGLEVAFARERGMEVVITDHHLPAVELPRAAAVVNPLRFDCSYPFKELCGAGIAFKLGQALLERREAAGAGNRNRTVGDPWSGMEGYLDLVTLATVADMVPLLGENRVLVTYGLRRMNTELRPGLAALCEAAAVGKKLTTEIISFMIAPRLNAAGRLGDASRALKLLLMEHTEEARPLAAELHSENSRRQLLEANIFAEASKMIEEMPENEAGFLLLAAPDWPQGVIGIVAGRLLEQYNRPVILVSLAEGQGKGSGRSSGDFNLTAALKECAHLLLSYGGHHCAAGLTVKEENIPLLRRELNRLVRQWREETEPAPSFYVDAPLHPQQITAQLVREIELLEPFGCGNPRPLFFGEKWFLERKREVGQGQRHLQLGLSRDGYYFPAICFNGKNRLPVLQAMRDLDVFFSLCFDTWRGGDALQLEVYAGLYCDEHIRGKLSLVDRRGLQQKNHYLRELVRQGEECLVFVNTLGRLRYLQQNLAGEKGLYFTHQGRLKPGEINGTPSHLVLYDLPLQDLKLRALLQNLAVGNNIKVHLLYGMGDWQDNLRLLKATIPSLSVLEQVILALQELAAAGKSSLLSETVVNLKRRLSFSPTKHLLEKCLLIMEEAACLELDNGKLKLSVACGDDYCTLLGTLALSEHYKWARKKWQEALRLQKYMLEAGGEEILALFDEGVQNSLT
ncbi:MAG: single-stranded-DNA-specific exonuclease RecJ [Bacillota bacterium]